MKTLLDAFNWAFDKVTEQKTQRTINPECCGYEMEEVESKCTNELGEYEVIGYKCTICGFETNIYGGKNE